MGGGGAVAPVDAGISFMIPSAALLPTFTFAETRPEIKSAAYVQVTRPANILMFQV